MTVANIGYDGHASGMLSLMIYAGMIRHNLLNTLFLINISSLLDGLFFIIV